MLGEESADVKKSCGSVVKIEDFVEEVVTVINAQEIISHHLTEMPSGKSFKIR